MLLVMFRGCVKHCWYFGPVGSQLQAEIAKMLFLVRGETIYPHGSEARQGRRLRLCDFALRLKCHVTFFGRR